MVGDAGQYFDPDDIDSMRCAMETALQSPSRRAELIRLGEVRRTTFSWERCARETNDVYQGLAA